MNFSATLVVLMVAGGALAYPSEQSAPETPKSKRSAPLLGYSSLAYTEPLIPKIYSPYSAPLYSPYSAGLYRPYSASLYRPYSAGLYSPYSAALHSPLYAPSLYRSRYALDLYDHPLL